jgi:cytochrome c oxidase subunit 2
VPVGRPVILDLTSNDVIHSFWIPALHGKRDLIPGRINHTQLRVDHAGVFTGMCAEFCGLEHAKMALTVVAEPEDQFESWLEASRSPAPEPSDELTRRGRDVFLNGTCKMCHAISGTDAAATYGPDLTHVFSRQRLAGNSIPDTTGWLAGWILDPQDIKPGVRMPPSPMESSDLQALLAYLETLR